MFYRSALPVGRGRLPGRRPACGWVLLASLCDLPVCAGAKCLLLPHQPLMLKACFKLCPFAKERVLQAVPLHIRAVANACGDAHGSTL